MTSFKIAPTTIPISASSIGSVAQEPIFNASQIRGIDVNDLTGIQDGSFLQYINGSWTYSLTGATGSGGPSETGPTGYTGYTGPAGASLTGPTGAGSVFTDPIAIGSSAGAVSQSLGAVAIGVNAASSTQGANSIAIGSQAGRTLQGSSAISIGLRAGMSRQANGAIAIGADAASSTQGSNAIAIGSTAGETVQGSSAISIGFAAGRSRQSSNAIAIGATSGLSAQGQYSIAIGFSAGQLTQGEWAVALGPNCGQYGQGDKSVCIGYGAGTSVFNQTAENAIVISALGFDLGSAVTNNIASSCVIRPLRENPSIDNPTGSVMYDTERGELFVDTSKTFVIDHPTDESKYLVHACLEGPEAGVYYRGEGSIVHENVRIRLPDYARNIASNFTVQVTPIDDENHNRDRRDDRILRSSRVSKDGSFVVSGSPGPFFWTVYGTRKEIDVEIDKTAKTLRRNGPYTYLV